MNKKELLQEGDPVTFQVSANEPFAINVKSNKQKLRSHVEAVKGTVPWVILYFGSYKII